MGTQGTGRKRSTKKERSTAEDDALNLIAREAEARLAAKRAARAEAREIRMKELERQQKEIFQVQKKYYGLDTKLDDRADGKWGDIEQWMEDSERYSRSSRIQTLSDDDERMSVGSRGSVRDSSSLKKSKKKKKHKHKDKDRNGYDDDYSVISSRSSRLSDESRVSRSSRLDLTSSRLSEDPRGSRASRLDLQPASYASSDLYSFNGLSSSRNPGSTFNGYQSSLYEDSLCSGSRRVTSSSSIPLEYTSYRSSGSRASSRASSARASPVDNCGSVASFLRSTASSSGLPRDLDDVTIPDFSDVEDRDYLEKGSRAASALTAATLTSLGGTSSRRGSGETALTVDAETSIREIKEIHELKDQIQDVETKYTQNLKEVKDALVEVEEKYRKAMVSNAQLDNEKNNLMYQVDTLKDSLMELEELLAESRRGFEEKVKEYEREKHAHTVLQFQFNEMKETLKQSEELLNEIRQLRIKQEGFVREISDLQETVEWKDKKIGALERQKEYTDAIRIERDELREEVVKLKDILKKHGIVLGPDLNINGEAAEAPVDGLPSADSASTPAKDSPASPPEGNSMLGNTEERLGSSGEEEVNPEQHQEMYTGAKDNHLNSDTLSNVAGASTLETFSQEQPTEEQQTCLEDKKTATEEDNVEEQGLSNDFSVDINVQSLTEAKDIIVCSPGLQNIVISSENAPETETPEGGDVGETVKPDSGDTETKSSSVNIQSNDTRESCSNLSEKQENEQEDEESNLRNTESCLQQKVARDVVRESSPDESFPTSSSAEPQQEPDKAGEAENDETEEISSKSQPQGTAASGKKKKRKKRGKKKGGAQEDKNQQKDETDKEKGKTEIDTESATKDDGPTTEPFDGSVTATLKELKVEQVKKEKVSQETEEVDGIEAVKPTETFSPNETVKESRMDHDTDEQDKEQLLETKNVEKSETFSFSETPKGLSADHGMDEHNKDQTLEMENAEKAETVTKTETFSHIETPKEVSMDHVTDEQNKEQSLETETVEAAEAVEAGEAAAHTETLSEVETLTESRTIPRKDEQDKEKTLETEKVEEVESRTSPIPETSFGTPDLIDNSKGAESTDGSEEECTSSVDNSKSETDISTNVIHSESENCLIVSAEEEVGSINDAENSFETSHKENTEAESHVPSNGDIAAAESEYTNNSDIKDNKSISQSSPDGFTDVLKSLSGSEPSSDLFEAVNLNSDDTLVKFSNEGPKKATETVRDGEDPGAEAKQDSLSPSILSPKPDGDESKLKADETEKELKRGTSEPEGLVETESSHDVKSVSCDNASLMKKSDPFDFVQSLLQTEVQATHLDDAEGQTLRHEDQMPESNAVSKVSSETKEDIDMLNTPNSPKETSEIRPAVKHDHSAEDPEPNSSKNEQQSQTKQLHESSIDKSDYNDSSQLTLQDSEEEDIDEGLSFDFDDMDIEAAVAASLPENQNQEEVEEGVEVMSVESNSGSSGLCQSNTESSENRQHEPVESNDEKHEVAGGTPVDKLDTTSRDNQNSSAHEDALSDKNEHAENMSEKQKQMPEEEVSVAEEPEHIIEEGKVLNVGELAVVAEDVNQVISVPAEEGLDAVMHDLQGEHLDLPKSAEQVASNKEPQQTEKDVKKNGKKGKGKGKEECKMS